jgi:hypothetical protein
VNRWTILRRRSQEAKLCLAQGTHHVRIFRQASTGMTERRDLLEAGNASSAGARLGFDEK